MTSHKAWLFSKRQADLERAIKEGAEPDKIARAAENARRAALAILKKIRPQTLVGTGNPISIADQLQWAETVKQWRNASVETIIKIVPKMSKRPGLGELRRVVRKTVSFRRLWISGTDLREYDK